MGLRVCTWRLTDVLMEWNQCIQECFVLPLILPDGCWSNVPMVRMGSQGNGIDLMVPLMVHVNTWSWVSTRLVCKLLTHTGEQYSAVEYTKARVVVQRA